MNYTKAQFKISILMPFAVLIFLLVACEKENTGISDHDDTSTSDYDTSNTEATVLFQFEYLNFAWGFAHSGWFIDNKGEIRGYNSPNDWKFVDSLGYITQDKLLLNYNQASTSLGQIDLDELLEKSQLIESTLNGELSERDCPGADIGSFSLHCYYWDSDKNKYKRQFLSMTGDCERINTADEAKELTNFLKQYI